MTTNSLATSTPSVRRGWIHFGVAAGIMLIATVGWSAAKDFLGWATQKYPVTWPEQVRVDKETFRNVSLPEQIGPYRIVPDGRFERDERGEPVKDGQPDGEILYRDDLLESLRVGTSLDKQRYDERKSNWYVSRIYEDTRQSSRSPYRYWQLDVTFYTGAEVTVPHVPDICAQAGGASLSGRDVLAVDVPDAPEAWRESPLAALYYEKSTQGGRQRFVQYYVFSVNGVPEQSRDQVRIKLTSLSLRRVYYAKIQFFPRTQVFNKNRINHQAKEFYRTVLPVVLRELPSRKRMQTLND